MDTKALRKELIRYVRQLSQSGWVVGTSGNISLRNPDDGTMLITPSSVDYQQMQEEDLFLVHPDGSLEGGLGRPTSSLAFHKLIMRQRKDCMAIIHTHAPYASAASVVTDAVPAVTLPAALYLGGAIPVSPYAENGSQQEAENIMSALGQEHNAVLMQNHGVVAIGGSLKQAWDNMGHAEECCRIWIYAKSTGLPCSTISC